MATYSKEFKDKLIKRMLPPKNMSVKELANEYHVHEQTLYKWRRKTKSKGTQHRRLWHVDLHPNRQQIVKCPVS